MFEATTVAQVRKEAGFELLCLLGGIGGEEDPEGIGLGRWDKFDRADEVLVGLRGEEVGLVEEDGVFFFVIKAIDFFLDGVAVGLTEESD